MGLNLRKPVQPARRSVSKSYTFPAPTKGWIVSENLALAKPGGARLLENWFPTTTSIRLRGGSQKYATISTGPVLRMWTYKSGTTEKFFASDATKIFNITTVADASVIPTADVTGQTSGYYSTAMFGTAGGNYQYVVNGTDSAKLYDGTTWTTITGVSAPVAITGVTTSLLSFVWSFSSHLWFIEKNTMNAWYLPVDAIGGAATKFSLAGVFQQGGALMLGGKWSMDAGDGLDDKIVFISDQGEVAVFQGTTPAETTTWAKVGIYQITPPMGPNGTMDAGGDFLIATEDGLVPISEAVNKDVAALNLSAISRQIEPEWKKEVIARRTLPWEIIKWPSNNMMVVALPVPDAGISPYCFVANLETGAWAKFTNWETRSLCLFDNFGYFGNNTGKVYKMEVGGSDAGTPYTSTYVGQPDHIKSVGVRKILHSARSIFLSNVPFIAKISASVDYNITLPTAPSSVTNFTTDEWDAALWDTGTWDSTGAPTVSTKWVSIGKSGYSISPQIQVTSGVTPFPRTELVAFDIIYELGGVLV